MFVTFEGNEGSGKSTLIQTISARFDQQQIAHIVTREPGGGPLLEKIREWLLAHKMNTWTELLLYEAARSEHCAQVIRPALKEGKTVLCDRFTDSSLAYQGQARGLPWEAVRRANELATDGLVPDLTVFLDIDPAMGLKRATQGNRFEAEGLEFHQKVREGFLRVGREDRDRWLALPVNGSSPDQLADVVLKAIDAKREEKKNPKWPRARKNPQHPSQAKPVSGPLPNL